MQNVLMFEQSLTQAKNKNLHKHSFVLLNDAHSLV